MFIVIVIILNKFVRLLMLFNINEVLFYFKDLIHVVVIKISYQYYYQSPKKHIHIIR
jgi:hypothetical protein